MFATIAVEEAADVVWRDDGGERTRAATAAGGLCSQLAVAAARVRDRRELTDWNRGVLDRAIGIFSAGAEWLRYVDGAALVHEGSSLAAPALMDEGWLDYALPDRASEGADVLEGWVRQIRALKNGDVDSATQVYNTFLGLAQSTLSDVASQAEVLLTSATE